MKTITLQKMHIVNFKGIKDLILDFSGKNTLISGYNAIGKSTIIDAFSWLLWNKNAAGATRFDVRPRDKERCEIHDIITTVETTLRVQTDGEEAIEFTMRRDELEDLTNEQRAQLKPSDIANKKSFYFIDMAPYKSKEFSQKVTELLAPEDVFMLVSNPMAFFQLKEDKQRELLFGSCGLVANEAVDGWQEVKEICGAVNTPEQTKEALEKQITACKRKSEEIPARIDSICKLYDIQSDYIGLIQSAEKEKTALLQKGKELSDEKETLIKSLAKTKEPQKPDDKKVKDLEYELRRAKNDVEVYQIRITDALALKAKNTCPNCGFIITDTTVSIEQTQKNMELAQERVIRLIKQLADVQAEYEKAIQEYKISITNVTDNTQTLSKIAELESAITEILSQNNKYSEQIATYTQAQKAEMEVTNLRQELREIDDQMANMLAKLDIVKEWIYRKNQAQMESINTHFDKVKFTLYEMQANGSYKPCCKATIDGVSYTNLNHAAKVYAGAELAKLFSKTYELIAPLFCDEKESIFELPDWEGRQSIYFKADETLKGKGLQVQQL